MENGQEEKESSPKPETPPEVMETEETEDKGASSSSPGTIPDYCFQSSPVYKNPAWCVNTNQYYVDLCNEIEGVSDVVKISMSQLQCWSPENKNSDKQEVEVIINIEENYVTVNEVKLEAVNIRYCYMPQGNSGDGDADAEHVLVISYWQPNYAGKIHNLILSSEEEQTTVKVMNLVRRIIGDVTRLKWFVPYMVGPMLVHKAGGDLLRIEELTADDYEVAMVTVDEELISFYPKGQLSEGGASVLRFTREQVEGAIDRIFAHTVIKLVEIETSMNKFIFKINGEDIASYKRFAFYVQGRIRAKAPNIFNFSNSLPFKEQMEEFPTQVYEDTQPLFVPVSTAASRAQRGPSTPRRSTNEGHSSLFDNSEPAESGFESTPTRRRYNRVGDAGVTDDENKVAMQTLIASLMSSTSSPESISEELQVMWFTLEDDASKLLEKNLVPPSDIDSGGLDENSPDHLNRAIKSIQDALFDNKIDKALSHLQGLKRAFMTSKYLEVTNWFRNTDEKEMLKQIYFTGSH